MKYFWEVLTVIYIAILIIIVLKKYYTYLIGKIMLAFIAGLLSSSLMKIVNKHAREK